MAPPIRPVANSSVCQRSPIATMDAGAAPNGASNPARLASRTPSPARLSGRLAMIFDRGQAKNQAVIGTATPAACASATLARDKLVSVLHQIITGSRAKYFVPVLELIATSFQSIIGSDGGGNDAQKCTHRFGMRNLHATRNVLRESLACLPNAPDAEKGSRRSNWSEISGFILA